jgi:hypothetical protein
MQWLLVKAIQWSNGLQTRRRSQARSAGVFFGLLLLTAALTEFFVRGRLSFAAELSGNLAASLVEILCMIAVTLLSSITSLSRWTGAVSLLAASFNFVGIIFEVLQILPRSANIGLAFHGFYWILIGYLIFRSTFLPRILGALTAIAGLCWLTLMSPALANYLFLLRSGLPLLVEGLAMLWLLVMGVNVQRWKEQASAGGNTNKSRCLF